MRQVSDIVAVTCSVAAQSLSRSVAQHACSEGLIVGGSLDAIGVTPYWPGSDDSCIPPEWTAQWSESLSAAKGVIFFTPIHGSSVASCMNSILDTFSDELSWKPVAVVAAAGSPRSHLAPLSFVAAACAESHILFYPEHLVVTQKSFRDGRLTPRVGSRLTRLCSGFSSFCDLVGSLHVAR
jgi:NAD(P)H-dependent FMN reductase